MTEVIQTCIPIVVGALIEIVPTIIEKLFEYKRNKIEKQELYVELISLLNIVI